MFPSPPSTEPCSRPLAYMPVIRWASRAKGMLCMPDRAVAPQRGQEEALATEDHRLEVTGPLDVVVDAVGDGDQAAGVDEQLLPLELLADHRAAGVDESQPVTIEPLQDETLAAEPWVQTSVCGVKVPASTSSVRFSSGVVAVEPEALW